VLPLECVTCAAFMVAQAEHVISRKIRLIHCPRVFTHRILDTSWSQLIAK
jgi:hypothetical protein